MHVKFISLRSTCSRVSSGHVYVIWYEIRTNKYFNLTCTISTNVFKFTGERMSIKMKHYGCCAICD